MNTAAMIDFTDDAFFEIQDDITQVDLTSTLSVIRYEQRARLYNKMESIYGKLEVQAASAMRIEAAWDKWCNTLFRVHRIINRLERLNGRSPQN